MPEPLTLSPRCIFVVGLCDMGKCGKNGSPKKHKFTDGNSELTKEWKRNTEDR